MSFESDNSYDENKLKQKASEMFTKTGDYLKAELDLTLDDYKLLEEMNKVTANKYKHMFAVCDNVSKSVDQMNDKYKTLLPNLQLIDKIEEKVQKLETMAYAIDAYSKRLGIVSLGLWCANLSFYDLVNDVMCIMVKSSKSDAFRQITRSLSVTNSGKF